MDEADVIDKALAEACLSDVDEDISMDMFGDAEDEMTPRESTSADMPPVPKVKVHKPSAVIPRVPKEESHWHRHCLLDERQCLIEDGEFNDSAPMLPQLFLEFSELFGTLDARPCFAHCPDLFLHQSWWIDPLSDPKLLRIPEHRQLH